MKTKTITSILVIILFYSCSENTEIINDNELIVVEELEIASNKTTNNNVDIKNLEVITEQQRDLNNNDITEKNMRDEVITEQKSETTLIEEQK